MTGWGSAATIGVDIGGTKIAAARIDSLGVVTGTARAPTPNGGAEAVLDVVAGLVGELADPGVIAVGVGAPGVVDPEVGVVRSATGILPGWEGAQVGAGLRRRTGLPAVVDNDVRAMAFGEATVGAGQGHGRVLYVSVGTGVGGAFLRNGEPVHGGHGTAGEIAHLLVPREGEIPCGCGSFDHLEAVAAGPAIAARYAAGSGAGVELPDVVWRMRHGDGEARACVTDAATLLGRCLAGLVTAVDVDAVVVGGGVAQIGEEFTEPLESSLRAQVRPPGRAMPVLSAALGTDAPLIGAGMLALRESRKAKS